MFSLFVIVCHSSFLSFFVCVCGFLFFFGGGGLFVCLFVFVLFFSGGGGGGLNFVFCEFN